VTIEVGFLIKSRGISWNLVEGSCQNRPATLEVGFLSESAS